MRYVRIDNNRIVREIIPAFDEQFPGVPITERYSPEFLNQCLEVADGVAVEQNQEFLPLQNVFVPMLTYTGETVASGETGNPLFVPVSFSEDGAWKIVDTEGALVTTKEDGFMVTGDAGEYNIKLRFTETSFRRVLDQTVNVRLSNHTS